MPSNEIRFKKAFTLVELLVVIAIMALLAYLTLPAFSSLSGAQAVNQGVYEVSSVLQLARSEAVSRRTYVWVGFSQTTAAGRPVLTMAVTSSKDGTTNAAPANLLNLNIPSRVDGVVLSKWTDLKPATTATVPNVAPVSVEANQNGLSFTSGQAQFTGSTITFTPRGEAMLLAAPSLYDPYDPYIDVSFRQSNTVTPSANANDASVLVEGGTGMVQTVRVQ
jgi:prepilin-type N-terminal cleavage/methylation domain-containing protein